MPGNLSFALVEYTIFMLFTVSTEKCWQVHLQEQLRETKKILKQALKVTVKNKKRF